MNKASWCLWLLLMLTSASGARAETFSFVALGDLPYGPDEIAGAKYRTLITQINELHPEFSIHVGDFKEGSARCSDEEFERQRKHFDLFKSALIYTPGDNDWTDCGRKSNGSYDPLERLAKLRVQFFKPDTSLGQTPLAVVTQAKAMPTYSTYIENQRWQFSSTLFTTVHIVGSDNRFAPNNAEAEKEFLAREQANIAWIKEAFRVAASQKLQTLVFAFQADVIRGMSRSGTWAEKTGFHASIEKTLLPLAKEFQGAILIVHGDSHNFEFDQTFMLESQVLKNVYRLEVPGAKTTGAVSVTIHEGNPVPFSVKKIIVP
ncbi:hypothetical protein MCERE10_01117 [Burkholderiaceae bacterium]